MGSRRNIYILECFCDYVNVEENSIRKYIFCDSLRTVNAFCVTN